MQALGRQFSLSNTPYQLEILEALQSLNADKEANCRKQRWTMSMSVAIIPLAVTSVVSWCRSDKSLGTQENKVIILL